MSGHDIVQDAQSVLTQEQIRNCNDELCSEITKVTKMPILIIIQNGIKISSCPK